MLEICRTNRFIKDIKLMGRRGKDIKKLVDIMEKLAKNETLERHHREHSLLGRYKDRRECHIDPDWLLIYKVECNTIIFERTGTHADLFQ